MPKLKLTLFYPFLSTGSPCDDIELRMSLRSIQKYLVGIDEDDIEVVICSDKLPKFIDIDKVKFEHVADSSPHPNINVLNKIIKFSQNQKFDNDYFILMNDDFILTDYLHVDDLITTFYYDGTLQERWSKITETASIYAKKLFMTKYFLDNFALPTYNFATHTPIPIYKKVMQHVIRLVGNRDEETHLHDLLIRPIYANYLKKYQQQIIGIEPKYIKQADLKLNNFLTYQNFYKTINNKTMFSIGDGLLVDTQIRLELESMFSNASKFEKT
jgi:hypothetical protein